MSIQSNVAEAISNWWWFLVKGLLFVVAGVAVLSRPLEGDVGLSILFSVCILGIGVVQIIFALGNRPHFSGWGWTLVSGIIAWTGAAFLIAGLVSIALGFKLRSFKGAVKSLA
jgi:uncharacterized membrane protein HdeD (DUF308 family)